LLETVACPRQLPLLFGAADSVAQTPGPRLITATKPVISPGGPVKQLISAALCLFLLLGEIPAHADFKYTDTSKITGGSLKSMVKFAGVFSKQASQSLKPMTSTKYIKGNMMRTDRPDGSIEIFDLDRKLVIQIDPQNRTYSQATFDEIRDAIKKATEEQKQKMQKDPKTKDTQVNMNAKVSATPGATGRIINGQSTNEMKMQIEMEVTAQERPDAQAAAQQPSGPVSGTISTSIDSWIAPEVSGYQEVADFYKKMAKELNWVPPSGITINPQVSQSMQELEKNQSLYKGLPILQYVTMSMAGAQGASANSQNQDAHPSSASNSTPTSPSEAVMKGFGGLFGKKKKKDDAAADATSASAASNPPPPPSVPGSLMEMTIEVSTFSDAALDPALFAVPEGYTKVASDPNHILGRPAKQ
jgi:hypothetical protein